MTALVLLFAKARNDMELMRTTVITLGRRESDSTMGYYDEHYFKLIGYYDELARLNPFSLMQVPQV